MGRPPKFSREQLQAAALHLVDRHGLDGLSMRALAAALGTGAMTLYNHVEHREDLEVLVVEAVLAKAKWPRARGEDWREDVRRITTAMWRAVRAHPAVVPLILTRRSRCPAVLEASEALLDALSRSGRDGRRLLVAFRAVTALVTGFAQVELAGPLSVAAGEPADEVIARMRSLPPDRYPRLIRLAKSASSSKAETEFREGLDLLLAGLAADDAGKPVAGRAASAAPGKTRAPR